LKITASDFIFKRYGSIKDYYRIGKILGTGSYSEVRMCVNRETGSLRAVKVLNKQAMDEIEEQMLRNEVEILKSLDHPNIVKLYEL
jgi:calcium-dependent protein kinase